RSVQSKRMPDLSTALAALVLLPLGVALVALVGGLLVGPLLAPGLAAFGRARFARSLARTARADSLLKAGRREAALRDLEQSFCWFSARDARLVEQIAAHHTGLLARLLTVIDAAPHGRVRLLSLAKVDRLLERRPELERARLQLRSRSWR